MDGETDADMGISDLHAQAGVPTVKELVKNLIWMHVYLYTIDIYLLQLGSVPRRLVHGAGGEEAARLGAGAGCWSASGCLKGHCSGALLGSSALPTPNSNPFSFSIPRRIRPWLARANDMAGQVAQVPSGQPNTKQSTTPTIAFASHLVFGTMMID